MYFLVTSTKLERFFICDFTELGIEERASEKRSRVKKNVGKNLKYFNLRGVQDKDKHLVNCVYKFCYVIFLYATELQNRGEANSNNS